MAIKELTKIEFDAFASKHEQANFHQTTNWGELKKLTGWVPHLLGYYKEDQLVAGGLFLSKSTPLGKDVFYSPRGFLIDYQNRELVEEFVAELKKYLRANNCMYLKIDPYVICQQRDLDGKVVEGGIDNRPVVEYLKSLGFEHAGYNLHYETLQPRWMFTTPTLGKTEEDLFKQMEPKTRQLLRKNMRLGLKCREIEYDEIAKFQQIMAKTGDRREFFTRPVEYYQQMWNCMHDDGMFKILFVELNTTELHDAYAKELAQFEKEYQERIDKRAKTKNVNEAKFQAKQQETQNQIDRCKNKLVECDKLKEQYGEVITMGGICFLIYGNEVLSLNGGTFEEFMSFQSAYTLHYEMVKYAADHGYQRYNFYGITGDFENKDSQYGLYVFKRGFGGEVGELIGEFDLVVSPFTYKMFNLAYAVYQKMKKIKHKLLGN